MACFRSWFSHQGSLYRQGFLSVVLFCITIGALSQKSGFDTETTIPSKFVIPGPPSGLFGPIEISPYVVPPNPYPIKPQTPMYPSFPSTYIPALTGRCPTNFSDITDILDKTASDCTKPLAALVGNVICCPQVNSLLHIFQGSYNYNSTMLVLNETIADDCFTDVINILTSGGASGTIPALCSVKSANLTGGSCPVKDIATFEKIVNTSRLMDACSTVDPLKECCRPTCQPAITEAAVRISFLESSALENPNISGFAPMVTTLSDCKGVVYAWLSRKLLPDTANNAFRILASCKVNKVCPLDFAYPGTIIKACNDVSSPNNTCCSSVNAYISEIQKQMLITNKQAINCAMLFGSMLQKGGITTNIYQLCGVDLKDFSLQAYGQQGCLLRSLPADVVFDNSTGFSFTCDLNDNIAAPWPTSSTMSSVSFCAPEMSLPALPVAPNANNFGSSRSHFGALLQILFYMTFHALPKL